jgi:hypothetical protein
MHVHEPTEEPHASSQLLESWYRPCCLVGCRLAKPADDNHEAVLMASMGTEIVGLAVVSKPRFGLPGTYNLQRIPLLFTGNTYGQRYKLTARKQIQG